MSCGFSIKLSQIRASRYCVCKGVEEDRRGAVSFSFVSEPLQCLVFLPCPIYIVCKLSAVMHEQAYSE